MTLRFRSWVVVGLALAALSLVATACGDGGEEAVAPSDGPESTSPASSASPSPAPGVLPTFDPDTALVEYTSPDKGYVIGHPEGWEVDAGPHTGIDAFLRGSAADRILAQLSVRCRPGENLTVEQMMRTSQAALSSLGRINPAGATPIEVAGTEGKKLSFVIKVADIDVEQVVAYAVKGGCGWRIGLAAYGKGQLQQYLPLFDEIIASFRTT